MDGYLAPSTRLSNDSIPKELMQVLPTDPSEQLEMAHRISNLAFTQKVHNLEQENNQLRQTLMQRQSQIKALERRVTNLELEVNDHQEKVKHAMEEQTKLVGEKNALIGTVKKLNRDLAKLDSFKRNLLQSLQDEDDSKEVNLYATPSTGTDMASDRLVSNVLSSVSNTGGGLGYSQHSVGATPPSFGLGEPRYGVPPTPVTQAQDALRRDTPGTKSAVSPSMVSSPPNAGGGVPGAEGSPRVDGKEFFRQARARLAYEQFSQFLQNIKELNAHRQTREETLRKAQDIFGPDNSDLYGSFESLLSRHLPL